LVERNEFIVEKLNDEIVNSTSRYLIFEKINEEKYNLLSPHLF
jgi:hypothetical protein